MSAPDLTHPTVSVEYAPLDPQASISEKVIQKLIDTPTATKPGPVDYIATPPPGAEEW